MITYIPMTRELISRAQNSLSHPKSIYTTSVAQLRVFPVCTLALQAQDSRNIDGRSAPRPPASMAVLLSVRGWAVVPLFPKTWAFVST